MLAIDKTLISDEVLEKQFVCDLDRCKGACCVAGESGAPLEPEELKILEEIYPKVKPYMTDEGIATIEKKGLYVIDEDGDYTTLLIERSESRKASMKKSNDKEESGRAYKKECAFTVFENGIAKCAIEKAYYDKKIDFKKPVSCHLYPIRITKFPGYDALNYQQWSVCASACKLGKEEEVPIYEFVKDGLIRKYGEEWFKQVQFAVSQGKY